MTLWHPSQRPGAAAGSAGCASKKAAGQRYVLRGSVPPGLLPGRGTIWDTWGRSTQSVRKPEPLIFPNSPACFCVHDVRRAATSRRTCPAAELGRRGPQNTARRGAYARLLPPRVAPVCPTYPWGAVCRRVGLPARPMRCTHSASVCARPTVGRARTMGEVLIQFGVLSGPKLSQVYNPDYVHDKPYLYTRQISVVTS